MTPLKKVHLNREDAEPATKNKGESFAPFASLRCDRSFFGRDGMNTPHAVETPPK